MKHPIYRSQNDRSMMQRMDQIGHDKFLQLVVKPFMMQEDQRVSVMLL